MSGNAILEKESWIRFNDAISIKACIVLIVDDEIRAWSIGEKILRRENGSTGRKPWHNVCLPTNCTKRTAYYRTRASVLTGPGFINYLD